MVDERAYLLDTDILISYLRGHPTIGRRMEQVEASLLHTGVISVAELWSGNRIRRTGEKQDAELKQLLKEIKILPFCERSAMLFAEHKAALYHSGKIIQDFDIAIAAIALVHKLTLVTKNEKDFRRIGGLKVENWTV